MEAAYNQIHLQPGIFQIQCGDLDLVISFMFPAAEKGSIVGGLVQCHGGVAL